MQYPPELFHPRGQVPTLGRGTGVDCARWDRAYPAIAKVRDGFRQSEPWEVASPRGRRMAGLRLTKGEPGVAFSGAAPARLRSTAALAFPIQAAGAELLKEALALLMPRL